MQEEWEDSSHVLIDHFNVSVRNNKLPDAQPLFSGTDHGPDLEMTQYLQQLRQVLLEMGSEIQEAAMQRESRLVNPLVWLWSLFSGQ